MHTCQSCDSAVENEYECPDCEERYCVDCRVPSEHECINTADSGRSATYTLFGLPWTYHVVGLIWLAATLSIGSYNSIIAAITGVGMSVVVVYAFLYVARAGISKLSATA